VAEAGRPAGRQSVALYDDIVYSFASHISPSHRRRSANRTNVITADTRQLEGPTDEYSPASHTHIKRILHYFDLSCLWHSTELSVSTYLSRVADVSRSLGGTLIKMRDRNLRHKRARKCKAGKCGKSQLRVRLM